MRRPTASLAMFPARTMLLVGVGAAVGAGARWSIAEVIDTRPGALPWATLLVNVVGCLAIGVAARRLRPATDAWFLAVTGALGGFTTWSTLANEVRGLADDGHALLAVAYLAVTVAAGLVAVEIGRGVGRAVGRGVVR
jgi:CrcB protein